VLIVSQRRESKAVPAAHPLYEDGYFIPAQSGVHESRVLEHVHYVRELTQKKT
jgi:hypothetical protein